MISFILTTLIIAPLISGFIALFLKGETLRKNLSLAAFFLSFVASLCAFRAPDFLWGMHFFGGFSLSLGLDTLSRLVLVFANLFAFLVCLFSKQYITRKGAYFSYLLWLLACVNTEILATDFVMFIFSWGAVIAVLYALLNQDSVFSAKKALTILGFSYFCFILGTSLYVLFTGSSDMMSGSRVVLNQPVCWIAFLLMLIGGFAKTGCGPLHTWIPQASETAPVTVMALLPASLDKLLGIYILSRIVLNFFVMNNAAMSLLLIAGGLTIMFAVMMALIQHDLRKLLAYHAISQAGYMVLGLGTGNPIGIVGAIFHMFNNAIYKNGLFLVGGAVEHRKKSFELDNLGGLARAMPLTFIAALVFALSISGIPPFNGFASKWMLYQGTLAGLSAASHTPFRFVYVFALIAAMFGSALTLASFIKFIHAIFLGEESSKSNKGITENPIGMVVPLLVLAGLCVVLGIFSNFFVKEYIAPGFRFSLDYLGKWDSVFVCIFMGGALLLGILMWSLMRYKKVREDGFFVGGETAYAQPFFPATEFYKTIEELPLVKVLYRVIKFEGFDLYNILTKGFLGFSSGLYFILTFKWLLKRRTKNNAVS